MAKKEFKPIAVDLEKDKFYYWCQCGHSKNQPFCDGSHKAYFCEPVMFNVQKDQTRKLCTCKQTSTPPYCDGTHRQVNEKDD
jgi:CDGSH-type Zn-finger protein